MYSRIRNLREDSKYETGENDVPTAILIKLAEYYKTNVEYILGLTDNPIYYKEI